MFYQHRIYVSLDEAHLDEYLVSKQPQPWLVFVIHLVLIEKDGPVGSWYHEFLITQLPLDPDPQLVTSMHDDTFKEILNLLLVFPV